LAAAIEQEFSVKSDLVRGTDGVFDLGVDGDRIFSKDEAGRFPTEGAILNALRSRR
jgi:predicted Rdx family selenoprotein